MATPAWVLASFLTVRNSAAAISASARRARAAHSGERAKSRCLRIPCLSLANQGAVSISQAPSPGQLSPIESYDEAGAEPAWISCANLPSSSGLRLETTQYVIPD